MRSEYDERISVRVGDVLADKYRVERVLGSGGMGVVVAARHLGLDERVAIKLLHPDSLTNTEAVLRFEREARAAAKIKSEHVARVSDVGTLDNGSPYMIMEYLDGEDLADWVMKRGPLAVDQAVEFILQTCEAMAEAHGLGIVHRDLKPANLFCIRRPDGQLSIKVLDFGISKFADSGPGLDVTHANAVMGSPLYMSPEQMVSARSVDARTDIWSLGIILYELISGRTPFCGANLPEVCISIASKPTPPLRPTRPDAPAQLDAVLARCLQKDRKKRYSNVAELAVDLAPFAPKRAQALVRRIARVVQSTGSAEGGIAIPPSSNPSSEPSNQATLASWGHTDAKGRHHRAGLLGVAAMVGIGVGAVAATMMLQKSAPELAGAAEGIHPSASSIAIAASAPSGAEHTLTAKDAGATAVSSAEAFVTPAPAPTQSPLAASRLVLSPSSSQPDRVSRPAAGRPAAAAPRASVVPPENASKNATPPANKSKTELGGRL
jgi:serine/threonine protein kinase